MQGEEGPGFDGDIAGVGAEQQVATREKNEEGGSRGMEKKVETTAVRKEERRVH